jgi:hypothetical protein
MTVEAVCYDAPARRSFLHFTEATIGPDLERSGVHRIFQHRRFLPRNVET